MSMAGIKAYAYDIAVENADGVNIYYNYYNEGKELEVTFLYSDSKNYHVDKTGIFENIASDGCNLTHSIHKRDFFWDNHIICAGILIIRI